MTYDTHQINIRKGATFAQVLRWEAPPIVWKPITAISLTAPVRLTVPAHGCPPNWRVNVSCNKSMREMNGARGVAAVIDADTIEINTINASGFNPYKGDGHLSYNTPVDLTAMTARMSIKDKVGGTEQLPVGCRRRRWLSCRRLWIVTCWRGYNHFCRRMRTERPDLIHQLPERHRYACTNLPLHQSR